MKATLQPWCRGSFDLNSNDAVINMPDYKIYFSTACRTIEVNPQEESSPGSQLQILPSLHLQLDDQIESRVTLYSTRHEERRYLSGTLSGF